jgi:hypothetical protein
MGPPRKEANSIPAQVQGFRSEYRDRLSHRVRLQSIAVAYCIPVERIIDEVECALLLRS